MSVCLSTIWYLNHWHSCLLPPCRQRVSQGYSLAMILNFSYQARMPPSLTLTKLEGGESLAPFRVTSPGSALLPGYDYHVPVRLPILKGGPFPLMLNGLCRINVPIPQLKDKLQHSAELTISTKSASVLYHQQSAPL